MILVLGNDPHKVDLPDLGDVVYFKQQKLFSDSQVAQSSDLRLAIKSGKLTVLQKYGNGSQSFEAPSSTNVPPRNDSKIDLLLQKLEALEKSVADSRPSVQPDASVVDILLERISKLEERIAELSKVGGTDPSLAEAVRQLAERVDSGVKDTAILDRLESILSKTGESSPGVISTMPEDVYVPTITVEDANSHIKLDVRQVETSTSDLDASLAALKKLRNK